MVAMNSVSLPIAAFVFLAGVAGAQAQVTKSTVAGVTNFAQVETTVACAGVIKPESVAGIRKMGFASIIDLQLADEANANIPAETEAAKEAGIAFFHIPFSGGKPDPAVADQFLKTISEPSNQPAFIHCASGNRAAAMWAIKRMVVDGWDRDRAMEEATPLGLTSPVLKTFAVEYAQNHRK
jgi:uncharacterized protein (TIGR01244 family)